MVTVYTTAMHTNIIMASVSVVVMPGIIVWSTCCTSSKHTSRWTPSPRSSAGSGTERSRPEVERNWDTAPARGPETVRIPPPRLGGGMVSGTGPGDLVASCVASSTRNNGLTARNCCVVGYCSFLEITIRKTLCELCESKSFAKNGPF